MNGSGNGDPDQTDAPQEIPLAPDAAPRTGLGDQRAAELSDDLLDRAEDGSIASRAESAFELLHPPPPTVAPVSRGLRLMPRIGAVEREPLWKRWLYVALVMVFLFWPERVAGVRLTWHGGPVGYLPTLLAYWAPAHPGINQNGYLVGGKMLAANGTMGMKPREPAFAFVGWMWNIVKRDGPKGAPQEIWYYPKYPIGNSALFAACLKAAQFKSGVIDQKDRIWHPSKWKLGAWDAGKVWAFYVNPVCMTLAMLAMFFLVRLVAGSFAGFMGMMILAFSQCVLQFADQPMSHGPSMCCVTWGMYFLLSWWQRGTSWRAILAGLFLGYAVTTRYTEGLLVLPLAATMVTMIRYDRRSVRWWSMSLWLAAALAGIVLHYWAGTTTDGWLAMTLLAVVGSAILTATILRRRDEVSLRAGELQHAAPAPDIVLPYRRPEPAKRRWVWYAAHVLRTGIAGVLVWGLVNAEMPHRPWDDYVAGVIGLSIFKACVAGALVLLYLIPWWEPRRYLRIAWAGIAWLIPVAILVGFNKIAMGSWTGYDTTNESTAFTWRMFADKWDDTVQQVYDYSIFLVPPLAVAGMFVLYRRSWRAGLAVTLWLVPGFLLYTSYYFGKQRPGMWYLRFFMTLYPPMVIAAVWLIKSAADGAVVNWVRTRGERRVDVDVREPGSVAAPLALGLFTFASCAVGMWVSLPAMERELAGNLNLAYTCDRIVANVPEVYVNDKKAEAVVFADSRSPGHLYPLNNMLQFAGDFELYPTDGFARGFGYRGEADPTLPNPLQAERQNYVASVMREKNENDMVAEQNRIMRQALDEGRPVYVVLLPAGVNAFKRKFITDEFEFKKDKHDRELPIDAWKEPAKVPTERVGGVGPLDPNGRGMPMYNTRAALTWHMYEIVKKKQPPPPPPPPPPAPPAEAPAATQPVATQAPATAPTTGPTTAPN